VVSSHDTGDRLKILHHLNTVALVTAALAITILSACNSPKAHPNNEEIAIAENEIYEAVLHHIVARPQETQLIFDETLLTQLEPGGDVESCKKSTRKDFSLEIGSPPYNSLADKAYRFFARGDYDGPIRTETIQSFLERSCTPGYLSQTFHTDLPRFFISSQNIRFNDVIVDKNGPKSFNQLYPGADGIMSFSHVGFNSKMDEAIVSTCFVCGLLCGARYRYILRKKSGRWQVADGLMVSVS
jgi:hypothetical protein